MKTFVTIFSKTENVHLLKDVGLIPYTMYKEYGYRSKIVCIKNGDYPYLESYVKGIELEFIDGDYSKVRTSEKYEYKLIKKYLKVHAKDIDVLNLYHYTKYHAMLLAYYKKLNPKGTAYLKLDYYYEEKEKHHNPIIMFLDFSKRIIRNYIVKKIDLITTESGYSVEGFSKLFNRKVEYLPNGVVQYSGGKYSVKNDKKNIFLTVGRLGSSPKNTELLLDAYADIYQKCNWNLVLVGTIKESLSTYMEQLFSKCENLRDRVLIKGEIKDKLELERIYRMSKVFLMPSRWENSSMAVLEAEVNGCFLILSDKVAPHRDFTDNGKYGYVVPSEDRNALADAMLKSTELKIDYQRQIDYVLSNFTWKIICEKLDTMLNTCR